MTIIAWALVLACVSAIAYWGVGVEQSRRVGAARCPVRRGLEHDGPHGKVSIVVPVHDGADVIDDCARMLRAQDYADLEIIFALDRCRDDTAARIAAHAETDPRVVVVEIDSCPSDWAGKCYAAWTGARHARGDWLLFTDADTDFAPSLTRAAVGLADAENAGMLTVLSTLRFEHAWERIVQPVAMIHLLRLFPLDRISRGVRSRPFANGQFLLFRRTTYDRIGGHEAVRHRLLEDIAFAQRVHRHGEGVAVATSDGMLSCAMYESFEAFSKGWQRIFVEACGRKPARLRKNARRVLAFGAVIPCLQLAALVVAALVARVDPVMAIGLTTAVVAGWTLQVVALRRAYRMCGAPGAALLAYPWASWIVGRIVLRGAIDLERGRALEWGGREYVLEPRGEEWRFRNVGEKSRNADGEKSRNAETPKRRNPEAQVLE